VRGYPLVNVDSLPVGALYGRSSTARTLLMFIVAARFCAAVLVATRPVRDSLFLFCSPIPAEGRVCQHTIRAPIESISTLNSSGGVSVPVVDCLRALCVGLEMCETDLA